MSALDPDRKVFLDGEILSAAEAKVSIFDRGYLFADGVYEVTAVVDGRLIDFAPHAERLERSLSELGMTAPLNADAIRAMHEELLRANGVSEGLVYMQITRGVAERAFEYPSAETRPILSAFTQAKALRDDPKAEVGIAAATVPEIRWARRDIKSIALLAQCVSKQKAVDAGASEGWMVEDGYVTEGTSSTAYIVVGDRVITRPLSRAVLAGVTRRSLLRVAAERQVTIEERPFTPEEAYDADEAFVTAASSLVTPVTSLDGRPIGDGRPGPLSRRLRTMYFDEVADA